MTIYSEGRYVTKFHALEAFVETLGSYPLSIFDSLPNKERCDVLKNYSTFLVRLCQNLDDLIVLRDSPNAPRHCLDPPSFPADVFEMSPR